MIFVIFFHLCWHCLTRLFKLRQLRKNKLWFQILSHQQCSLSSLFYYSVAKELSAWEPQWKENNSSAFFFFPPLFPSCDLNPAGEGENSHVRHVGGAQLCKLHACKVFGMDPLAFFVFHGRTQGEATFSTLTAATCCSVLHQRNPEAGESHCALALDLQGSLRYQGCALVPMFFLLCRLFQDVKQIGLGVQMLQILGATWAPLWCRLLWGIFKFHLVWLALKTDFAWFITVVRNFAAMD